MLTYIKSFIKCQKRMVWSMGSALTDGSWISAATFTPVSNAARRSSGNCFSR